MTTELPKIIWLLWLQGEENATSLVKRVIKTWRDNNPGWEVRVIDTKTLGNYIYLDNLNLPNMTAQAASDIIRLRLLKLHGGVWADASLPCLRPLDDWVTEAIEPAGIWMYHGRDRGRGPASWFIVAKKTSILINRWCQISDQYWNTKPEQFEYHWLDILFSMLLIKDEDSLNEWKKVPFKWCEDDFSAHSLAKKVFLYNPDLINSIANTAPFVVKLCNHGVFHKKTNAYLLLDKIDNKEIKREKLVWDICPSLDDAVFFP